MGNNHSLDDQDEWVIRSSSGMNQSLDYEVNLFNLYFPYGFKRKMIVLICEIFCLVYCKLHMVIVRRFSPKLLIRNLEFNCQKSALGEKKTDGSRILENGLDLEFLVLLLPSWGL